MVRHLLSLISGDAAHELARQRCDGPSHRVFDGHGKILDTSEFPTTSANYRQILARLRRFGDVAKVGVEGTGSYGAGLFRFLTGEHVEVLEVNRPNRQMRR
jgi:transposase